MSTLSPAARDARNALDLLNVKSRKRAETLLSMWARRPELSPADVAAILTGYRTRGGAR